MTKKCKCAEFFGKQEGPCRLAGYPTPALCGRAERKPVEPPPVDAEESHWLSDYYNYEVDE